MENNRAFFAKSFCGGRGIEIGALHHPVRLPPESRVRYLDRFPTEELRRHFPELRDQNLVHVDIVDSGETLGTVPDSSEDFLIAAQFIEHCENPIRAIVNMLRLVRPSGFVFLTAPDKRFTFDVDRPITTNEHLLEECMKGPALNRRSHFLEVIRLVHKVEGEAAIAREADKLMAQDYSIHYHVWDSDAFLGFLLFIKGKFKLPTELYATLRNGNELMVALPKPPA